MNLPAFSVNRPVFATMAGLIVIVLGLFSLTRLKTDLLPEVELPTISVETSYPGVDPETMERRVTQIVEEIVATVPGVEEIRSTTTQGRSDVSLTFGYSVDPDAAVADVRATLEDEINELPDDVERPQVDKFDPNSFPVVILGIAGNLDPVELTQVVEDEVRYRFARVPGVAQVDLWGGYNREVRVELDPDEIRALGLPINQILDALRDANLDLPAGEVEQGRFNVTLRAPGEFQNVQQIRDTTVAVRDGAAVTFGDIATVADTFERIRRYNRINNELGIRVGIRKQADANTVDVAAGILEEIERANAELPQLQIIAVSNQGNFIERSIRNVAQSVMYGGLLAIGVLLFFLRNVRSTLVVAVAIPISIIATFALLYFGGLTLNLMTLGGLALGVGLMVDNAIVVLENIYRRRDEEGESPNEAAINGSVEVGGAIVASTVTTLVIFLPLVFVQGVSGVLFQSLGYVVAFSLACSLAVSLSLVPMLASKLLKPKGEAGPKSGIGKKLLARSDRFFHSMESMYRGLLDAVLQWRWTTVLASLAVLGLSLLLFPLIGTEFLPPSDEGEVSVDVELEVGTRLEIVDSRVRRLEELVLPLVPEAQSYVTNSGWGNRGDIRINVGEAATRDRSNAEIADAVRAEVEGKVAGGEVRVRAPQGQRILERILGSGSEGVEIEIRGFELEVLEGLAARVEEAAKAIEGVSDVDVSRDEGVPEQQIDVDRVKAGQLNVSIRQIAEVIETAIAGSDVGDYRDSGNSFRILVRLKDAEKLPLDEILNLTVRNDAGEDIALRNVVTLTAGSGPTDIQRKDQQRLVTVTANVAGRPLGDVAGDLDAALAQIPRPAGYGIAIAGAYEEQQEAFNELLLGMGMALLLVYMVLACQYESLRDPLIVMAAVPTAAIGVLLMLFLTDTTFNVQSYIGCIMLGGIVVNNAILLVDQANQLRRGERMSSRDAVAEAGRRRLRPILMTTLTTLLGLAPLALGIGEGADAQAPLARAVIGGLAASTIITLVLVPVVYTLVHRDKGGRPAAFAPAESAS